MNPSVYLYREIESEFELYLGEFSTLDGLKAINEYGFGEVHLSALNFCSYIASKTKMIHKRNTHPKTVL
jgi:hypothetical protein